MAEIDFGAADPIVQPAGGQPPALPAPSFPDADPVVVSAQQPVPSELHSPISTRLAKMGGSEFLAGALGTLGFPMSAVQAGYNAIGRYVTTPAINLYRQGVGYKPVDYPDVMLPSTSQALVGASDAAGLTNRPDLQPQGPGERYFAAAARGTGAAAPLAPLVGPLALIQGAGGGVGGQGAKDLTTTVLDPKTAANPYVKFGAELGGSLVGSWASGMLADTLTRAVNASRGSLNELGQSYNRTGVEPRLPATASEGGLNQNLLAYTSKAPGSSGSVQDAIRATLDDFREAVERMAGRFGASRTPQQAGEALQDGARTWLSGWDKATERAWGNFWRSIPEGSTSEMPATRALLSGSDTAMASEMPELSKALQDQTIAKLAEVIAKNDQPVSGQLIREFRTAIGDKLKNAPLRGGEDIGALKQLYGALTTDIKGLAAASGGEDAVAAFNTANNATRSGYALIESTVGNILGNGARAIAPEQATAWATGQLSGKSGGGTRLTNVREAVGPDAMGELAALDLRNRAAAPAGFQNEAGNAVSPARMVTQFAPTNLAPEARAALYGGNQGVEDLVRVADSIKGAMALRNTSNTGPYAQMANLVGSAGAATLGGGIASAAGSGGTTAALAAAAGAVSPLLINRLGGAVETSRALTRLLMARGLDFGTASTLAGAAVSAQPAAK